MVDTGVRTFDMPLPRVRTGGPMMKCDPEDHSIIQFMRPAMTERQFCDASEHLVKAGLSQKSLEWTDSVISVIAGRRARFAP